MHTGFFSLVLFLLFYLCPSQGHAQILHERYDTWSYESISYDSSVEPIYTDDHRQIALNWTDQNPLLLAHVPSKNNDAHLFVNLGLWVIHISSQKYFENLEEPKIKLFTSDGKELTSSIKLKESAEALKKYSQKTVKASYSIGNRPVFRNLQLEIEDFSINIKNVISTSLIGGRIYRTYDVYITLCSEEESYEIYYKNNEYEQIHIRNLS
ncbi:MAG: hypothetical protein KDD52_02825 [Bdellovibrionales bacterium]|nr:hypothetical protein [Bdellovibrionales bacterium]